MDNAAKSRKALNAATQQARQEQTVDAWVAIADLANRLEDSNAMLHAMEQARKNVRNSSDRELIEMHEYLLDDE